MSYRIRLIGLADGRGTTLDGWFLVSCDVNANNGRGSIHASPVAAEAMIFSDAGAALAYWQRQSTKVPVRPDGKPNRPLTAYTVEVEPTEERTHAQDQSQDPSGHPASSGSPDP